MRRISRAPIERAARAIAMGTALLAVASAPAAAGERAGIRMPDTIQVAGKTLYLNGLGVREATLFNVDVYVAGLYLEHRSKDPGEILGTDGLKVIHLRFVHDVGRKDVVSSFTEGFKKNAGDLEPGLRPEIARLMGWLPGFEDGDTLTLTYVPGDGTRAAVNGKARGTIAGADFARALFAIWLGPHPPNRGLKRGLLGD
jgi:hypothetical protein